MDTDTLSTTGLTEANDSPSAAATVEAAARQAIEIVTTAKSTEAKQIAFRQCKSLGVTGIVISLHDPASDTTVDIEYTLDAFNLMFVQPLKLRPIFTPLFDHKEDEHA